MRFGKTWNQIFHTLELLGANTLFWITTKIILANLMLTPIMTYFLVIQFIVKYIESTIKGLVAEKSVHITFDEQNALSRNTISNDWMKLSKTQKNLMLYQAQMRIHNRMRKWNKHHQVNKMSMKIYLGNESLCKTIQSSKS